MPDCLACHHRPVDNPDAYACTVCADQTGEQLRAIGNTASAARDVVNGQTRRGPAVGGGGGGRLPVNLSAASRIDAVQNEITTWARIVHGRCGGPMPAGDPLEAGARYLAGHVDWLRYQSWVPDAMRDIAACARIITAIVDPPAGRRYLGPCRTPDEQGATCEADVYGRIGADRAHCRSCGASHDVLSRRGWLDGAVRAYAYTPAEVAAAYGIRAGTIRIWAYRGLLQPAVLALGDGVHGPLQIDRDEQGRPRYLLGDVLDLAATEAARRATAQARRARRAEQEEHEAEQVA